VFQYSWSDRWSEKTGAFPGKRFARVTAEHRESYVIANNEGEWYAELSGRYRFTVQQRSNLPAVGDWIAYTMADADWAIIHGLLPRENAISRKVAGRVTEEQILAANVDVVLIVTGPNEEFNLNRIRRFLFITDRAGAQPVIVINKSDLLTDVEEYVRRASTLRNDIPVVTTSAVQRRLAVLSPFLTRGCTAVLMGSSGVGKTTIVNALLGTSEKTKPIRSDDKGRHTTTVRHLHVLPNGAFLIDSPGLRELQLWASDSDGPNGFDPIEELAVSCRFVDCTHRHEPGCAVQKAVQDGILPFDDVAAYLKFRDELIYLNRRQDESEKRRKNRQDKIVARRIRQFYRHNPKYKR
jgi:ribosome biogenesis GTPase